MTEAKSPEQMLSLVLDALPVRIFWKDRDSCILGCNQAFADDAGVADRADLFGRTHFEFYPREQAQAYRADDLEVMATGRAKLGIAEDLLLASGKTVSVDTQKLPLRDVDGAIIGVVAVYDTTESRRVAESLTAVIEDLTVTRDAAVAAAVAKSRFIANMSIELRRPLDAIIAYTELLQREPANDSDTRDPSIVLAAARDLLELVNDIFDMSKFAAEGIVPVAAEAATVTPSSSATASR